MIVVEKDLQGNFTSQCFKWRQILIICVTISLSNISIMPHHLASAAMETETWILVRSLTSGQQLLGGLVWSTELAGS